VDVLAKRVAQTMKSVLLETARRADEGRGSGHSRSLRVRPVNVQQSKCLTRARVRRPPAEPKITGLDKTRVQVDGAGFVVVTSIAHGRTVDLRIAMSSASLCSRIRHRTKDAWRQRSSRPRRRLPRRGPFPPWCSPSPEIAWAELTESQAADRQARGDDQKFPWGASGSRDHTRSY